MFNEKPEILRLVNCTPIIHLRNVIPRGCSAISAKLEMFNPGGSIKDRTALNMILEAEKRQYIREGSTIIEPTSGNTGIALAMISAIRGYHCIIVIPEDMSEERIKLIEFFGAEIIKTPASEGVAGALTRANELKLNTPSSWMPNQFHNRANVEAHRMTTGPEIITQSMGRIDAFVAGIGTGGTITGVARAFKERSAKDIPVYGVEPAESPVISSKKFGKHGIQGIGAGFVPPLLDRSLLKDIITVNTQSAYKYTRELARKEGILAGVSSGAALAASIKLGLEMGPGYRIVTIFPDGAERYLTTKLFSSNIPE